MIKHIALVLMTIMIGACNIGPPYDGDNKQQQAALGQNFKSFKHTINEQTIAGVHSGKACNPAVIFIHGAPGDWKAWGRYLGDPDLSNKAFMIAIDRPGYGQSPASTKEINIKAQSAAILSAARKTHKGPFILVGHSYGGPIQLQMAADFPDDIKSMTLLAGAASPKHHKARWYHHLGVSWFGQKAFPTPMQQAAAEMTALQNELEKQEALLKTIKAPATIIQGGKDWLVPSANADFIKDNLTAANTNVIALPNQGHFIPWEQYDLVKREILKQLSASKCTAS